MTDLNAYYLEKVEQFSAIVKETKKELRWLSLARLAVFLITIGLLYVFFSNHRVAIILGLIGIAAFLFLLVKHTNKRAKLKLNQGLLQINKEELRIISGDFHFKNEGLEFQDSNHDFCLDIDLFGRGSFFQNLDRTATQNGALKLSEALKANDINDISKRQEAIKELSHKVDWRQKYQATASLIHTEHSTESVVKWLSQYEPKLPSFSVVLAYVMSALSISVIVLAILEMILPDFVGYVLLLGLGVSAVFLKTINHLATYTSKVKDTFKQYATLLEAIESEDFKCSLLKEQQDLITNQSQKASQLFKRFSNHLDALDNRNNLIGAFLGNGYFLNDLRNAYHIEKWILNNKATTEQWFKTIAFFDAYNSFGNYAFNHQSFVYPELVSSKNCIKATNLGHPLLNDSKRVSSDLLIDNQQFFIVTGANMAGKSTFLRTVSLHIVMANVGLPVCATKSDYAPIKLITSMRTTDNLTDDSSYFFSELTRLKYIVDAIKRDTYFIILDEILKGTNSKDKAEGSHKFVKKLVETNATGIIATHDLSLCTLEQELQEVNNHYFDAEIVNDELFFDYKFKTGICQNMNASFLLKKMEIV